MADVTYTYSISTDFPNGKMWSDLLLAEVKEDPNLAAKFLRIDVELEEDSCHIIFSSPLTSGEKTSLDAIVAAHTGEQIEIPRLDDAVVAAGYEEEEYNKKGFLIRRTRYAGRDEQGNLIFKIDEEQFKYKGTNLKSHTYTRFDIEGNELEVTSSVYETEKVGNNLIVRRKKES